MSGAKQSLFSAFCCAFAGVARTATQRNFRIECCFGVLAVMLGIVLRCTAAEWLAIVLCIASVLGAECMNTALEALCDAVHPDYHPLVKAAKDGAAGGVLLLSIGSVVVAGIIFLPKLIGLLG